MGRTRRKLREDWRDRLRSVNGSRRREFERFAPSWTREEIEEVMSHELLRDRMLREVKESVRREFSFDPFVD